MENFNPGGDEGRGEAMIITPQELRIGNLVYAVGGVNAVKVIRLDSERTPLCEPIPLTEEWLRKFGANTNSGLWFNVGDDITVAFDKNMNCSMSVSDPSETAGCDLPHIKFVHQLQNLYFELTGCELEIKELR